MGGSFYRHRFALLFLSFFALLPIACSKAYTLAPLSSPTNTPTPSGAMVITVAGSVGVTGANNATGTAATFNYPQYIAVDSSGNLYVADFANSLIRKITAGGTVSTLAGGGPGIATNGTGTAASFDEPRGVAVDVFGNVYVCDWGNEMIREISPSGVVSTVAGQAGVVGAANGTGAAASFNQPDGIAVDSAGNLYVGDCSNQLVRKIAPGGVVSTLAGQVGVTGGTNGPSTTALFDDPDGVAVDSSGNVYVADQFGYLIRKITPSGVVSTLAGSGTSGFANGIGTAASFGRPDGIAIDSSGNIYVADSLNDMIREVSPAGVVTTLAGQAGVVGSANGSLTSATFNDPVGVAVDSSDNVYVADDENQLIRKIIP